MGASTTRKPCPPGLKEVGGLRRRQLAAHLLDHVRPPKNDSPGGKATRHRHQRQARRILCTEFPPLRSLALGRGRSPRGKSGVEQTNQPVSPEGEKETKASRGARAWRCGRKSTPRTHRLRNTHCEQLFGTNSSLPDGSRHRSGQSISPADNRPELAQPVSD